MLCHICNEREGLYWSCCGCFVDERRATYSTGCDHEDGQPTCGPCGAYEGWWDDDTDDDDDEEEEGEGEETP